MEVRAFEKTEQAAEWAEYERWLEDKNRSLRIGTMAVVAGIVLRVVGAGLPPIGGEETQIAVGLALWLVALVLPLWGGLRICRAKGRHGAFALLMIVPFLLQDRNVREAPNKPATGVKKEGALFSDW